MEFIFPLPTVQDGKGDSALDILLVSPTCAITPLLLQSAVTAGSCRCNVVVIAPAKLQQMPAPVTGMPAADTASMSSVTFLYARDRNQLQQYLACVHLQHTRARPTHFIVLHFEHYLTHPPIFDALSQRVAMSKLLSLLRETVLFTTGACLQALTSQATGEEFESKSEELDCKCEVIVSNGKESLQTLGKRVATRGEFRPPLRESSSCATSKFEDSGAPVTTVCSACNEFSPANKKFCSRTAPSNKYCDCSAFASDFGEKSDRTNILPIYEAGLDDDQKSFVNNKTYCTQVSPQRIVFDAKLSGPDGTLAREGAAFQPSGSKPYETVNPTVGCQFGHPLHLRGYSSESDSDVDVETYPQRSFADVIKDKQYGFAELRDFKGHLTVPQSKCVSLQQQPCDPCKCFGAVLVGCTVDPQIPSLLIKLSDVEELARSLSYCAWTGQSLSKEEAAAEGENTVCMLKSSRRTLLYATRVGEIKILREQ